MFVSLVESGAGREDQECKIQTPGWQSVREEGREGEERFIR
jgi:hypothetical protein